LNKLLQKYPPSTEFLLDMLHDCQDAEPRNYLSAESLKSIAEYVGVPLSEVVSTATFYSMYSLEPRGRHIIRLCDSPPCRLVGAESLLEVLCGELGIRAGETTEDGTFTLETSSCLGVCGVAPAMMIDEELYGNLTRERITAILGDVRRNDAAS
jgi:NADH-quinone oxidoreductase subunit E